MDDDALLQDFINSHLKNPKYIGSINHPTERYTFQNPYCSDEVTYDLSIIDGVIKAIRFTATGCVLSRASADLICELLHGKSIVEVLSYSHETILRQFGEVIAIRKNCAIFGLEGIQAKFSVINTSVDK